MNNISERTGVTLGLVVLLGLCTLTAAVPIAGYVILGLIVALVVGVAARVGVLWWQTRWQAPEVDIRHRPARVSVAATRTRREVA